MKRIRVDTDQLHRTAGDFETAAADIVRAGDEALSVAMSLPEYGGRLSGPARNAGYEIQRRCREMGGGCRDAAAALDSAARAYEAVDGTVCSEISTVRAQIISSGDHPLLTISGGNQLFGYEYLTQNLVVIWFQGKSMRVDLDALSPENWRLVMLFINKVDSFDSTLAGMPDDLKDILVGAFLSLAGAVTAGTLVATILGAIAGGVMLGAGIYEMGMNAIELYESCEKLIAEFNGAGDLFLKLYSMPDDGIQIKI